jgi:hypothetical protein
LSIIEHHFNLKSESKYQIVNINLDERFYTQKFTGIISSPLVNYVDTSVDFYNTDMDKEATFPFLKNIPFVNFFKTNLIDVPRCFIKTKSLKRQLGFTQVTKFINYIMLKGFKQKTLNTLMKVLYSTNFNIIQSTSTVS